MSPPSMKDLWQTQRSRPAEVGQQPRCFWQLKQWHAFKHLVNISFMLQLQNRLSSHLPLGQIKREIKRFRAPQHSSLHVLLLSERALPSYIHTSKEAKACCCMNFSLSPEKNTPVLVQLNICSEWGYLKMVEKSSQDSVELKESMQHHLTSTAQPT